MTKPLILIVEDADNVTPLVIALECHGGLNIRTVSNGRDALELLKSGDPNLAAVVTDLDLPFVDGLALVAAIRSHKLYSRLPIVVVSGSANSELSDRARRLGANAFFPKPYSPAEVRQKLSELIYAG